MTSHDTYFYHLSMQLICCKDETAWVQAANQWVQDRVQKNSIRRMFIPAGETPRPLYASWEHQRPSFLKQLTFVQIDDVVTGPSRSRFKEFFLQSLPSYSGQIEFFDSGGGVGDVALLGLGLNGHVAFHEPGLSSTFYSGCVKLSQATREVLKLDEEAWGATYGLEAFRRCEGILLLVRGERKREILEKVLRQDASIPASQLMRSRDLTILTDFQISM